jgi:hypothetical protein
MKRLFFITLLLCSFSFTAAFPSGEQLGLSDVMISLTFKGLAKAFVSFHKKEDLVKKISDLDDVKFRRKYARAYQAIKGFPGFSGTYGFKEGTTKEELIKKISSWDNRKMCEMIDAIPDTAIAAEFKRYLSVKTGKTQKTGTLEQASWVWDEVIGKIGLK